MHRQFAGFILAFALVACPAAAQADPDGWASLAVPVFKNLTTGDGLPNDAVTDVVEDGDGFLWVGTHNGLARWDGYHFRTYRPDPNKPGTLPEGYIRCLHVDAVGHLWIGTNAGGLARYERESDSFSVVPAGAEGLVDATVRAIEYDPAGGLWVGTGRGLDHLDPTTGAVSHLGKTAADSRGLADRVSALLYDRAGRLWIGTDAGLFRRGRGDELVAMQIGPPSERAPTIWALFEDSSGAVWVGTKNRGGFVIRKGADSAQPIHETEAGAAKLETESVKAFAEGRPGEIWLSTYDDSLLVVAPDGKTRRITYDPVQRRDLGRIWALHRDRAGLLWVGGDNGLSRLDPAQTALLTLFGQTGGRTPISDRNVQAVFAADDGRIWLGLGDGINIIDPLRGRVRAIHPDPTRPAGSLPKATVFSIAATPGGRMWVGTDTGLYRTDAAAARFSRIILADSPAEFRVSSLLATRDTLWVGTENGLWRLDPQTGRTIGRYGGDVLTDTRVWDLAESADGALWIGTINGLNRLDPGTNSVERIVADPKDPQGLSVGYVSTLLTDRRDRLWIGTEGGGVHLLDGRDDQGRRRFRHFAGIQGLSDANVDRLLEDRAGYIWASTDDGIAMIDPDAPSIRTFHNAEGAALHAHWVDSGASTADGALLFGGVGGLTIVRPDRLDQWGYRPPVVVTDLRVGGEPRAWERFDRRHPLIVRPEGNSVAVEFAALDFSSPERNLYAYRLEGVDKDWLATDSSRRLAVYANLPPGDYTLWLRGSNRDGAWSEKPLEIPIRVLPAWHQTVAFKLACAAGALLLLVGLVHVRTVTLQRQRRLLEQKVALRTQELVTITEDLRGANAELDRLANVDPLTGLFNRRYFFEMAAKAVSRSQRHGYALTLFMVDIDHFKRVNDSYGHGGGDTALAAAAKCLKESLRDNDTSARYGGEELVVLLPDTDQDGAMHLAERFRHNLENLTINYDGTTIKVTASIGVSSWRSSEPAITQAIERADQALYRSKKGGRNRVTLDA